MGSDPEVSGIVPTRAQPTREALLRRAIRSIENQEGVTARSIVVVNGPNSESPLVVELRRRPGIRVLVRSEASLPHALALGRDAVNTPWFASLDDDDVLLPGALARRIASLRSAADKDVLVTNGIVREAHGDSLLLPTFADVAAAPLRALVERNWLLPGSWLARSDSVGRELFAGMPRFLECTYLAIRFATTYKVMFDDAPTVAWYANSPDSVSGSRDYAIGQEDALQVLLRLDLPSYFRANLERKLSACRHSQAGLFLAEAQVADAWRKHLQSLRGPGGSRYLSFTARLLKETWSR